MIDHIFVLDQVYELQILVSNLKDLNIQVPESLQVRAIISKLPPSWNDCRIKLLHFFESFTLDKLHKHLQIEEETQIQDRKKLFKFACKVDYVYSQKQSVGGKTGKHNETSMNTNNDSKSMRGKISFLFFFIVKGKEHFKIEHRFWKLLKKDEDNFI